MRKTWQNHRFTVHCTQNYSKSETINTDKSLSLCSRFGIRRRKFCVCLERVRLAERQMGIPSEMRDMWVNRGKGLLIPSPAEEQKMLRSAKCTQEGVKEGFKAAVIACVLSTVPTLAAVRMIPWAKHNLNYTAQALIICGATISSYFITADKTILACARKNAQLEDSLRRQKQ